MTRIDINTASADRRRRVAGLRTFAQKDAMQRFDAANACASILIFQVPLIDQLLAII